MCYSETKVSLKLKLTPGGLITVEIRRTAEHFLLIFRNNCFVVSLVVIYEFRTSNLS